VVNIGQKLSPEKLAFSRDFSRDLGFLVCAVWEFQKTWPATNVNEMFLLHKYI